MSDNACHCILLDLYYYSTHHCNSISFKGDSGELAPSPVEPLFVSSLVLFFMLLGALWKVRRMNLALRGRHKRNLVVCEHHRHHRQTLRSCIWMVRDMVWVIRALWCGIKYLCRLPQLFLRFLAAAVTISSAPQLESQHLAIEAAVVQHLLQFWNEHSLMQGLMNIMASFNEINHPIQCDSAKSPNSNCSSPAHYEYHYGVVSSSEENNEQHLQFKPFSLLAHGHVRLINSTSVFQIDHICQCQIVESRYQQMLYKVFADNSDLLDSCLYKSFNSVGLCMDKKACMDASQFTQSAKRFVKIMKTAACLLCAMWKELAETDCHSFHQDLKDHYFAVCARRPIENIIEVAHSIISMTWSASNLYQMLVLYEMIFDVLPAVQKLRLGCSNESAMIFQQMIVNFKGVSKELKFSICDNLNRSQNGMKHVCHPGTKLLIHYVKLFKNHKSVVQQISCFCDGSFSLGHFLSEVISYWAQELEEHSRSYRGKGRNYIFLLNNLTYFDKETADPQEILLHNSNYQSRISNYKSRYLEECWRPLLDCLELSVGMKPRLSLLTVFTSKFDDVYDSQRTLVLHTQLKGDLQQEIQKFVIPAYGAFLTELQKKPAPRLRPRFQKLLLRRRRADRHMTVEEMTSAVEELFESEHTL